MRKIGIALICLLQFSCISQNEKINGVSFVAAPKEAEDKHVKPILEINSNYAAIMPFGFVRNLSHPNVVYNAERQWFGETRKGAEQYIKLLQQHQIKIMLKPQLWVWRGEFTGDILMNSEEDWKTLEKTYEDFIITYAELANDMNVEIYCIGTELEEFVKHRPDYWSNLIKKVKAIYKGKLTYAANWDEYTRTPFWGDLDYIGVDAYFPLSENKSPTLAELKEGWQRWKKELKTLSTEKDKPILFTEWGYRSMDYTGKKPWLVDRNEMETNFQAQADATRVIIEEFWKEKWFAGGFVWKWFIDHKDSGGDKDNRFTPQNKPAELVLKELYRKF